MSACIASDRFGSPGRDTRPRPLVPYAPGAVECCGVSRSGVAGGGGLAGTRTLGAPIGDADALPTGLRAPRLGLRGAGRGRGAPRLRRHRRRQRVGGLRTRAGSGGRRRYRLPGRRLARRGSGQRNRSSSTGRRGDRCAGGAAASFVEDGGARRRWCTARPHRHAKESVERNGSGP